MRRAAKQLQEDPDQLMLPFGAQRECKDVNYIFTFASPGPTPLTPFPPIAGATWQLSMRVDYPAATDPALVERLDRAGRRLSRGAVASNQKLRKLAGGLEAIAGLFDSC